MKVTTDACVLGAYVATHGSGAYTALDVGTGTGLLALMLAQGNEQLTVDAIEIAPYHALLAAVNFELSPFADRLHVLLGNVHTLTRDRQYDIVVCNPPFFSAGLTSRRTLRETSMRDSENKPELWATSLIKCSKEKGKIWVLYPPYEAMQMTAAMNNNGWHVCHQVKIRHSPHSDVMREILCFSIDNITTEVVYLSITEDGNTYSSDFVELLKAYYLHL